MMSRTHKKRIIWTMGGMSLFVLGCYLILTAFWQNMDVYTTPKDIAKMAKGQHLRLGGVVKKGSLRRHELDYVFVVEDESSEIMVNFHGVPPALFRESQGVIAEGVVKGDVFVADRILAKHDENYRPPNVKLKSEI